MAQGVALASGIYLGPFDMSAYTSKWSFGPMRCDMKEFPNFGAAGYKTIRPGLFSMDATVEAWQDYAANALDQTIGLTQFVGRPQYPFSVVPQLGAPTAVAAGDRAYLTRGILSGTEQSFDIGEPVPVTFAIAGDTGFCRGYVAAPSAARSSTLTGTAVAQAGPTASQFLYASLHVFATTGSPTLTVTVQSDDSSGFSSATTRITFTQATSTPNANWYQWSSLAGDWSTETHLRVVGTYGGSGTITWAAFFGVA